MISLSPVDLLLRVAAATVGAGEHGGPNAGPYVERVQRTTGNKPPDPWCASWVADVGVCAFGPKGWPVPKSAGCAFLGDWAQGKGLLRTSPVRGDVFLLYYASKKRFAHTGLVTRVLDGGKIETIEGNTNSGGSREGWLVATRTRVVGPDDRFIRWTDAAPTVTA